MATGERERGREEERERGREGERERGKEGELFSAAQVQSRGGAGEEASPRQPPHGT